ncbi:unnamed protein product [Gongylonema pulchrum]|uniref:AB hydrolase-1 domain-containing protein n=1 Tax=Gongylonema pulchrum TaxID=637853 RepID=A0A183E8M5_9BILA|nr:unnamed protein product [Gongylonema pulchrum]
MGLVYTIEAISPTSSDARIPVVLIHGFAGGVGLWAANIDAVAKRRFAYCFDLLGFGRSSRPTFAKDPALIELQFVQSIEDWRKEMQISQMILVGHSFGAFLASSYAIENPERVRHLVLVDPWGFPEKPPEPPRQVGVSLIKKMRPDLSLRYGCADPNAIYEYIYQCNAQEPTGETAFIDMSFSFGWAKRPMLGR